MCLALCFLFTLVLPGMAFLSIPDTLRGLFLMADCVSATCSCTLLLMIPERELENLE